MVAFTSSSVTLALACLLARGFVAAQSKSAAETTSAEAAASSSAATSTTSSVLTHTVSVAYGGFTFSPDVTLAEVGDIIEYDFFPPNHSVARAEFGFPCIPYEDTGVDKVGFFSGFKPVDAIIPNPPKFSIRVNDTEPIFFYCTAPNSCIGHQMVGVINPNATTPLGTQKALAANSSFMLQPGEPWPSESEEPTGFTVPGSEATSTTSSSSAAPTSTAPTTTAPPAATSSAAVAASSHSGLTTGAIAGIAIGAAAVAILAAALLYMCGRQSRRHEHPPYHPAMGHTPPQPYMTPHMSYVQPKHMSTMTSNSGIYGAPGLPGYIPQHDPAMSPPLHPVYPANEPLAPASDITSPGSPDPSQTGFAAPAYQQTHPQERYPAPNGVHEMDTPEGHAEQGGIISFIRKASTRKSGVERYG